MHTLPFHLVHEGLSHLKTRSRALPLPGPWRRFKGDIAALRELTAEQETAVKLLLMAETAWLSEYLDALHQNGLPLHVHSPFLSDYFHGLMRVATAHAFALHAEELQLRNLSALAKLERRLNRDNDKFFAHIRESAQHEMSTYHYGELSRWCFVGMSLYIESLPKKNDAAHALVPYSPSPWPKVAPAEIAYDDYLTHQLGGHLLTPSNLNNPTLMTAMEEVPEALAIMVKSRAGR